jgi:L-malate glycosyltransferase
MNGAMNGTMQGAVQATSLAPLRLAPLRLALLADAEHVNTHRWCEGLRQAGAEVHVLSFGGQVPDAARTYRLPVPRLPGKLQYVVAVPCVRRLLREIRPDALAAYYVTGYGFLGALVGFHPLIQVTSGSDVLRAPRGRAMRHIVRYSLRRADLVTAWAPHMAEAARRCGVAEERLFVLPRGIPVEHFARWRCAPPSASSPGGPVRLISTRGLRAPYHLDRLIQAVALARQSGLDVQLTIAGDGPKRTELENLATTLGLCEQGREVVRFTGFVPNEALPALLAEHHLSIALTETDGVSASLLEAMAVGLWPVVPDNPGNRAWIQPGLNGTLLHSTEPAAVAAALQMEFRLEACRHNVALVRERADFGRNARLYVERFRQVADENRAGQWANAPVLTGPR